MHSPDITWFDLYSPHSLITKVMWAVKHQFEVTRTAPILHWAIPALHATAQQQHTNKRLQNKPSWALRSKHMEAVFDFSKLTVH